MRIIRFFLCLILAWSMASGIPSVQAAQNNIKTGKVTVEKDNTKDSYVYFTTSQKIWKMNTNTGAFSCIWDPDDVVGYYSDITCVGNDLYYVRSIYDDAPRICRLDVNGQKETELCLGDDIHIYGGKIYYSSFSVDNIDYDDDISDYRSGISSMDLDGNNKSVIFTEKYIKNKRFRYCIFDGKIYFARDEKKWNKVYRADLTGKVETEIYAPKRKDGVANLSVWNKQLYIRGPEAEKGWYGLYSLTASKKQTKNIYTYRETDNKKKPTFERRILSVKGDWIYMKKTDYSDGKAKAPTLLKFRVKDEKKVTIAELSKGNSSIKYFGDKYIIENIYVGGEDDYYLTSLIDIKNETHKTIEKWWPETP